MMTQRILVAGIGNIFLGDDGFGVEVVQRLGHHQLPENVRVVDFGIRGFDLAYALLDDYGAAILVDAVQRGGAPGSLYVIEPELNGGNEVTGFAIETHNVNPGKVLSLVTALGGQPKRLYVIGCEPATFGSDGNGQMGLSEPVQAVLEEAVGLVQSLVERLLTEGVHTGHPEPREETTL